MNSLSQNKLIRLIATAAFCMMAAVMVSAPASAADYGEEKDTYLVDFDPPWDEELIAKFARMPVQDGGRIKPFDSIARYTLLKFHGRQSIKMTNSRDEKPTKRSATEWALYALFAPDTIKDLPLFVIDDSGAAVMIGFKPDRKRDRYSYNEIYGNIEQLRKKAIEFSELKDEYEKRDQGEKLGRLLSLIA